MATHTQISDLEAVAPQTTNSLGPAARLSPPSKARNVMQLGGEAS